MPDESPTSVPNPPEPASSGEAPAWERELLERLAFMALVEQRRTRRWNLVFRCAWLALAVAVAVFWMDPGWLRPEPGGPHSALVDVRGMIADEGDANADQVVAGLRAAFEDSDTAGVILRINSPGGSPVQAGYISDEIVRLRGLYPETPVYAVVSDMAVSGGYYVAAAADSIYASKSSVVGSIGVLVDGFGFVDAMTRLGVERRLVTAGEHKGLLDPFSPARDEDVAHLRSLLDDVHDEFIEVVKRGRGDRLAADPDIFSGLMWTGAQGIELGLVDAFGSSGYVAREVIGAEEIVDFTVRPAPLDAIADRLGASVARTFGAMLNLEVGRLE
ncbi:MAG: S49 family peptidase [Chromatiales bacterium]|nr:S49 family peptidase [Chromatiales bacterium]